MARIASRPVSNGKKSTAPFAKKGEAAVRAKKTNAKGVLMGMKDATVRPSIRKGDVRAISKPVVSTPASTVQPNLGKPALRPAPKKRTVPVKSNLLNRPAVLWKGSR